MHDTTITSKHRAHKKRSVSAFSAVHNAASTERSSAAQPVFTVWCPALGVDSGLAEAIHALYYLPDNFILMFPRDSIKNEEILMILPSSPLADRIRLRETPGSPLDEATDSIDAVVGGDADMASKEIPMVHVSHEHGGVSIAEHGFDAACSPEAIASALLNISRIVA